jgi:erythromycin esterase-like protein/adenine/guanine phosphoribosyltransferase-like PRPP-binding protein
MRFRDRVEAGRRLAERLTNYANRSDVLVLALPRGGVPVGAELATRLGVPLDVFLVRKVGVPGHGELAMGAIAEGAIRVRDDRLLGALSISQAAFEHEAAREGLELERRIHQYRGTRPAPSVGGQTVILVDDGLATGSTMEAAIRALRTRQPARIVVAVPVGAADTCHRLSGLADAVVCLAMPEPFNAVGLWYDDFSQTTDEEVGELLAASRRPAVKAGPTLPATMRELIRERAWTLAGTDHDYDRLLARAGAARMVLLGEATHGTHEFYRERARITRQLITQHGFTAIAVEADWPDAYRVNRYVRGEGADRDAAEALGDFERFPHWMWRNADVLDFLGWLRSHNDGVPVSRRVGFYGIDLYSMRASMQAVLQYLSTVDPDGAARARERYSCFDRFGEEPQSYGYATQFGLTPSCEREAIDQLVELHRRRAEYASRDGRVARDAFFFAEQNARLVTSAEAYYRSMFGARHHSWNLRDRHMADTLVALGQFLREAGSEPRVVVWAHNSHLGDARATEMGEGGELNVGQLVRERFGAEAVLVGFSTDHGTVTAATEWDGPAHRRRVRPALSGSYEQWFHEAGLPRFVLPLKVDAQLASALATERLERAIGVIYVPESERRSHYFRARLPAQFDFLVHIDETRAVEPLERTPLWADGEVAETFPSGL